MKKTIVALALAGFAASSFAAGTMEESAQTLQWQGTVPAATVSPDAGYFIKQVGTTGLMNGTLTFTNAGGDVALTNSSTLSFKVIEDTNGDGIETPDETTELGYGLTLTNVKVGVNAATPAEQVDGFFKVQLNGTDLAKDVAETVDAAASTSAFKVVSDAGVTSTLVANDAVVLQAVLAVAPTAAAI